MSDVIDDHIGLTERLAILDRLDDLFGGRVWREKVPNGIVLPRYDGLLLKPYALVSFHLPVPTFTDRGLGIDEKDQPQLLRVTTRVLGGVPADVEQGNNTVVGRLRDWSPNPAKTSELKPFASASGDKSERRFLPPVAYERVNWECTINSVSAPLIAS